MGYIYPQSKFYNAQNAFIMLYDMITREGIDQDHGTKAVLNFGFYIENPLDRGINVDWRNFSEKYAEREWKWYLSKNRSVEEIKKYAPIWDKMHNGNNIVNSNYGYQWSRKGQIGMAMYKLLEQATTRQAWISIYDGKEWTEHTHDTPCTLNIGFKILGGKLCMTVIMRSNDLWYGFCNDQYCFSKLQEKVAKELDVEVGWYYHFAADLHVYKKQIGLRDKFYEKLKRDQIEEEI